MDHAWTQTTGPPSIGNTGTTTLLEGSTFCISTHSGDVHARQTAGLFVRDIRVLAEWVLEVDSAPVEALTVIDKDTFEATFVSRAIPRRGTADSTVLVLRERHVSDGMTETILVRNLSNEVAALNLSLRVASDFADLFEVKEGRLHSRAGLFSSVRDSALELVYQTDSQRWTALVEVQDSENREGMRVATLSNREVAGGTLQWLLAIPARGEWSCELVVRLALDDHRTPAGSRLERRGKAQAIDRSRDWRERAPKVRTASAALNRTLEASLEDLGALRIFDETDPARAVVAAGAPWFMALFGRDSLLTSWMALPLDPSLALGTLQSLAELQGELVNPLSEEEPGKILHEVRFGKAIIPLRDGNQVYYGSADATPLFVALLGELQRWGLEKEFVDALIPAADRALQWLDVFGDSDGDGFVEYHRKTDRGLINQGWKDSFDGINFSDGTLATAPIALCEIQAYTYSAFLARAHLAEDCGDDALAAQWGARAADLKAAFNERFWLPERGWYAVGLDDAKRPIDALTSNIGHCLWAGIADEDKAARIAEHLLSPDMFSGWGVRTLAKSMSAYNPMSYHNGSVWPHDNAIIVAGLMRYGFVEEAVAVANGILAVAEHFGGRMPELFCGFDRSEFPQPIPYPTACSPQAWSAASPLLIMRSLLRFDPQIPHRQIRIAPVLPDGLLPLRIDNVALAGGLVTVRVDGRGECTVEGVPTSIDVIHAPRRPMTDLPGS